MNAIVLNEFKDGTEVTCLRDDFPGRPLLDGVRFYEHLTDSSRNRIQKLLDNPKYPNFTHVGTYTSVTIWSK